MAEIQMLDLKELVKQLKKAGADKQKLRTWLKSAKWLEKEKPRIMQEYMQALDAQKQVGRSARALENLLITVGGGRLTTVQAARWNNIMVDFENSNRLWTHPFLVASDDREYRMVYDAILKMGQTAQNDVEERVLLQSEVENLLSMISENLEQKKPNLLAYGYYSMKYPEDELLEMTPMERRIKVQMVFEEEFLTVIRSMILRVLDEQQQQNALLILERSGL